MDAKVSDIPVRINVPEPPLRGLPLLQMLVKNPIGVWPASVYREPFVRWRVFRRDIVFVSAPSLIREVLVDQAEAFEKGELIRRALRPALGEGILTADGGRWRWQRRAAAPIFRPDRIVSFVPTMVEAAEHTRQRWLSLPPGTEVNVAQEMMHTTFEVILATMFAGGAEMDVTAHRTGHHALSGVDRLDHRRHDDAGAELDAVSWTPEGEPRARLSAEHVVRSAPWWPPGRR